MLRSSARPELSASRFFLLRDRFKNFCPLSYELREKPNRYARVGLSPRYFYRDSFLILSLRIPSKGSSKTGNFVIVNLSLISQGVRGI